LTNVIVNLSSALTGVTHGEKQVDVIASTLGDALDKLANRYGHEFSERILDPTGKPKRFINFYINGKNAHFLKLLDTQLNDGDEITILPSVSGG
jgi:molybdopterin synthase sulfur carrier subunit